MGAYMKILIVSLIYVICIAESYPTLNLRRLIEPNYEVNSRSKKDTVPQEMTEVTTSDDEVKELDELKELSKPVEEASENSPKEEVVTTIKTTEGSPEITANAKTYHGGARLAFGQRPEVLVTASTTTVKTTSAPPQLVGTIPKVILDKSTESTSVEEHTSDSEEEDSDEEDEEEDAKEETKITKSENEKEQVVPLSLNNTKAEERRSVTMIPPKMALDLLGHNTNVRYSPFDLAQYIFWTGDESGVAKVVEEFIKNDMMTQEEAIDFLKEIHKGIKYLQNSYRNKIFNNDAMKNHVKKSAPYTTTTKPRIADLYNPKVNKLDVSIPTKSLDISLPIPYLMNLQNSAAKEKDLNEKVGRAKIADFLYNEYSLEQIVYQLAKDMFTQSLTKGSAEAQKSLQKLTNFLENEREISPYLEKKILDVILSALSDTLVDHPELLKSSTSYLSTGYDSNRINSMRH